MSLASRLGVLEARNRATVQPASRNAAELAARITDLVWHARVMPATGLGDSIIDRRCAELLEQPHANA